MRRILSLAVPALFPLLALVLGCGRDSGPPTKGGVDKSGPVKVAFVSNNAFQFWTFAQRGAEQAGKDLGVEVEVKLPAQSSANLQQEIIEDLLVRGVQGIAISPQDAANMQRFFKRKIPANVTLLTVDSDVPDPTIRKVYLGTNNYLAGRAAGELMKKAAPEGGKVVIFVGKLDVQNAVERRQGVIDVLKGVDAKEMKDRTPNDARNLTLGKYTLVETRTDDGDDVACQKYAEDIFTRESDIAVCVGLWAYNPPAMLKAAEKLAHKTRIIGFDEDDRTLAAVQKGTIVGTVVQSPYKFGYESVKILSGFAKGDVKVLEQYPGRDAENRIYVEHRVITPDNVAGFREEIRKLLGK
jgi:ribose transport system substrate-binding protein